MPKNLNVSIDVTKLLDLIKENPTHSAFSAIDVKSDSKTHVFANVQVTIWDEKDKYNKDVSIVLNGKKDFKDIEEKDGKRIYIGGGYTQASKKVADESLTLPNDLVSKPSEPSAAAAGTDDDMPF